MKIAKAREICTMFRNGLSITEIANYFNNNPTTIRTALTRWYKTFFNEDFVPKGIALHKRAQEIYDNFIQIYAPFSYSRKALCKKLNCTATELDYMLRHYDLSHLRLHTYEKQITLCNVPREAYEEYKEYANKHNMSLRQLTCTAINQYILMQLLENKQEDEHGTSTTEQNVQ